MASICKINGRWRALVRRKNHKSISKWFDTKSQATAWADDIESQLDSGKPLDTGETVADLIKQYRQLRAKSRPIIDTSTEHYTLKQLEKNLGDKVASRLTVDDLLGWALKRRDDGAGPYTINCDLSKLGTVFRYAQKYTQDVVASARPRLSHLGLIGGGGLRERRPTEDELLRICEWLELHKGLQYRRFVEFAVATAMRRGEIASLLWTDLDTSKKMILVRDRKDPRKKVWNDQWVPLLFGSFDLVLSQPRDDDRIFPIHPQTISKYFTECCSELGIPDLHLHDMRHDGISKMFESGFDIPHVSVVSGHRDWKNLKRYTQIAPESLHSLPVRQSSSPQQPHQPTSSHRQDTSEP